MKDRTTQPTENKSVFSRFLSLVSPLILIFLASLVSCTPAGERSYPYKPLTYTVPWSPGGGTDLSSRSVANSLQQILGKPVNVVNRTGGGGVVGHLALSRAANDGYTIGAITVEICMMHWQGMTDLTNQNYTPIAMVMDNAAAITVSEDAPWNSLDELIKSIKENPGELQASGTSRGGIWDIARIGFLKAIEMPESAVPWVPSQGAAPALQELLAGGVDIVTAALAEVDPLRQAGQVKVLGVMADERLENFPEVPTLKEQGVDWSLAGWVGLGAPEGLDPEVSKVLVDAAKETMADSSFIASMKQAGFNIRNLYGEEFGAFMNEQNQLFGALMKDAGLAKE